MIKFYEADKPSMPEQVQLNKLNIDELKKTIEANEIYNANTEIDTSATTITTDDVKNWDDSITNGYILDTIGNLFKIVAVESGNIYIDYACTLPSGIGITSIVAGVPTTIGNTTTTPLTITYSNGTTTTINITAQRGATGATGATGNGIAQIRSFVPTVEDGKTITPLEIEFTNGTTQTIYVQATNGADGQNGTNGTNGTNGADGVGISNIVAGASSVSGNTTITPLTITFTNGTTTTVNVVATNGATGATGANGVSITNVTSGTATISGNKTITPLTITFSNNTSTTVSVEAQNGSGGGSQVYMHNINIVAGINTDDLHCVLYTNSSTQITTLSAFITALNSVGGTISATGWYTEGADVSIASYLQTNDNQLMVIGMPLSATSAEDFGGVTYSSVTQMNDTVTAI